MDSCMRAYSTVQHLLCHGGYCELFLSLARTSCRLLFTAYPTARPLDGKPWRNVVRFRNQSKSTLTHDAVATAVLHKHHPIIHVGAGLIQFVYRSHLRLAMEDTLNRNAFSPFFPLMCGTPWNRVVCAHLFRQKQGQTPTRRAAYPRPQRLVAFASLSTSRVLRI